MGIEAKSLHVIPRRSENGADPGGTRGGSPFDVISIDLSFPINSTGYFHMILMVFKKPLPSRDLR